MEVLISATAVQIIFCNWVFFPRVEENQLSSVWPKDLRLTFNDNLVIVTITLTFQWSTRATDIRAKEELHSCVSQFLPFSLPCILACLSFIPFAVCTYLSPHFFSCYHLPFVLLLFFSHLSCAFSFYFAHSLFFLSLLFISSHPSFVYAQVLLP